MSSSMSPFASCFTLLLSVRFSALVVFSVPSFDLARLGRDTWSSTIRLDGLCSSGDDTAVSSALHVAIYPPLRFPRSAEGDVSSVVLSGVISPGSAFTISSGLLEAVDPPALVEAGVGSEVELLLLLLLVVRGARAERLGGIASGLLDVLVSLLAVCCEAKQ